MKLNEKIFVIIVSTIGLYAVFLVFSDLSQIRDKLFHFNPHYLPIILFVIPISWLALFARWYFLMKSSGNQIPLKENLKIYFAGFALAVTPGKFGELVKSEILKKKFDIPRTTTAPLVLVERLYDLVGAVAVSIIGIWSLGVGSYVIIVSSCILVGVFTLLRSRKLFNRAIQAFTKTRVTSRFATSLSESYDSIQKATKLKTIVISSLFTITYWLIEAIGVYLIVLSFGINNLDYFKTLSTYASSLILGAASFIPGGLGVTEGSMAGLFHYEGVDLSLAFVLVIIIRFCTIWYSVGVGFIALKISGGFALFSDSNEKN